MTMTDAQVIQLLKALADRSRLEILRSLAAEDMYVERLAERLALTPPTVSFHLKKLAEAGAVESYKTQYYTMYRLCREALQMRLLDAVLLEGEQAALQQQRDEQYRRKVLDTFFRYGELQSIPVQRKKRRIVLEELVKAFDEDRLYSEKEVSDQLAAAHEDYCALRRCMIEERLMTRDKNGYRRVPQQSASV